MWKAFLASAECRPLVLCLAEPWRGAQSVLTTGPFLSSGTSEKNYDSLGIADVVILSRVDSPYLSREAIANRRDMGEPWLTCHFHGCVCDSPSAVLVATSHFPKRGGNKYTNSSFTKMEFRCKERSCSNSRETGGKAAVRYAER